MANNSRDEKFRQEKLELLKMKQGIIEESEIIPEDEHLPREKPRGLKRISNFFYHNSWYLIPLVAAAAIVVFFIVKIFTQEKADIDIVVAFTEENSKLMQRANIIEETIEKYCPDFDGNGKIHVNVEMIDLTMGDALIQYADIERQKFTFEEESYNRPLTICDKGFINDYIPSRDYNYRVFTDFDDLPDGLLYGKNAVLMGKAVEDFPDDALICVRNAPPDASSSKEDIAERRRRALIVLDNVASGNIVNPEE